MPPLSRSSRRLLTTVGGKRHASEDDHEERVGLREKSLRLQDENTEDIYGPPESSSDLEEVSDVPVSSYMDAATVSSATSIDIEGDSYSAKSQRRQTTRRSKRTPNAEPKPTAQPTLPSFASDAASDSADDDFFGEMGGIRKKQKRPSGYVNRHANFQHPPAVPNEPKKASSKGYQKPKQIDDAEPSPGSERGFRAPPKVLEPTLKATSEPKFKAPLSMLDVTINNNNRIGGNCRRSSRVAELNTNSKTTEPVSFRAIPSVEGSGIQTLSNTGSRSWKIEPRLTDNAAIYPLADRIEFDDAGFDDTEALSGDEEEQEKDAITCPYCHDSISDPTMITTLKRSAQMNMSRQAAFCRSHRHAEAQRHWDERGYPDIQWNKLPSRVEEQQDHVCHLIRNATSSTFRSRLEERIAAGGDRSMLQTLTKDDGSLNSFTPGYYGGRGAKLISSQLMATFASEIRDRAGRDKVIGAVGASGFVQAVLVPEVAVRLIMEDLGVAEAKAVMLLEESAELGYLLWEADEEDVASEGRELAGPVT